MSLYLILALIASWVILLVFLAWLARDSKHRARVASAWLASKAKHVCIEPALRYRSDGRVVYQPMIENERCYKSFTSSKYETYDHIWLTGDPMRQIVQRRYRWMAVFTAYFEVRRRNKEYNSRIIR